VPEKSFRNKQRFFVDEDTLYWELVGSVNVPEIHEITDTIMSVYKRLGICFVICDGRNGSAMSPEVRAAINRRYQEGTAVPAPSAVINANYLQKTILNLLFRAVRLLGAKPPPVDFVSTAEEAQVWLARKRAEHGRPQRDPPARAFFTSEPPPAQL